MPRFYRRYRRRPRRYVRRWFRRRFRRYINGSSRSTVRIKVPVHFTASITQAGDADHTAVATFCPLDSSTSWASVLGQTLYQNYANMYDEVKIIGMKCLINVSSPVGGAEIPSLQIYTGFDRRKAVAEALPSFDELKASSTYQVATAVNNSVAKLQRSLYASDLLEKAQWHDATLSFNPGTGVVTDLAYVSAANNPNFFVPALYVAFAVPGVDTAKTITYTADLMYYFAFRNPKFGGGVTRSANRDSIEYLDRNLDDGGDDLEAQAVRHLNAMAARGDAIGEGVNPRDPAVIRAESNARRRELSEQMMDEHLSRIVRKN